MTPTRSSPLTQTRRIPPAGKSHLGLAGRWSRWGRVGRGAVRDCIQLGVELGEPLVLAPQLLRLRRPIATSAARARSPAS